MVKPPATPDVKLSLQAAKKTETTQKSRSPARSKPKFEFTCQRCRTNDHSYRIHRIKASHAAVDVTSKKGATPIDSYNSVSNKAIATAKQEAAATK